MSELTIKGTIKVLEETKSFGSNGFEKRDFVIETEGEYPQSIKLEFVQQKCELLDKFAEGQNVEVSFNLRGNEYNGKYYTNLQAWKINLAEGEQPIATPKPEPKKAATKLQPDNPLNETFDVVESAEDDLPF